MNLFVDLDGVLVNFAQKLTEIGWSEEMLQDRQQYEIFKEFIQNAVRGGLKFWSDMRPMPDAFILWNEVKQYNPVILSSTGGADEAVDQKTEWVRKYLGFNVPVIIVNTSTEKAQYANPESILIDDREQSIRPWRDAGGIGILHTSAKNSIDQLNQILNSM